MRNIEQVLNVLQTFSLESVFPNKSDEMNFVTVVVPGAQKEFDALKAAGINVEIEQVERVKVTKTKSHRGGRTKNLNRRNHEEKEIGSRHNEANISAGGSGNRA